MSDEEKYYDPERDGEYRDITTLTQAEIEDWQEENYIEFKANESRQIAREMENRLTGEHPVSAFDDPRVAALEDDEHAHGGPDQIMASRMKERELRNIDPKVAGDCIRTLPSDIEFSKSRLRRKFNIE